MRKARLKAPPSAEVAYYHCVSRVVNREFVFGPAEKDRFVQLMRIYERFSMLRVISYCVMSNHFHILVEVPKRPAAENLPDDPSLVSHVRSSLGDKPADALAWELEHLRSIGGNQAAEQLRERWFARMWDISPFMKTLKQRFTQWFNRRHEPCGTLWEDRFRSVLVQGQALKTIAAYIDLNPVRANICEDPKDYRWCSYADAVAGGKPARQALSWIVSLSGHGGQKSDAPSSPIEALQRWRCLLFGLPESDKAQAEERAKGPHGADIFRKRISREKALEVLANGGRLPETDYLRCRIRYFTDGAAIGTRDFIEEIFSSSRSWFSKDRKTGARPLRGLEVAKRPSRLYNLRQLQKGVFG